VDHGKTSLTDKILKQVRCMPPLSTQQLVQGQG
jgi:predicted membrane GTPase involved in stress response